MEKARVIMAILLLLSRIMIGHIKGCSKPLSTAVRAKIIEVKLFIGIKCGAPSYPKGFEDWSRP